MQKLSRADLYSLEQYAEMRDELRRKVMEHKRHRRVDLGPNAVLYFEDRVTMLYQVQEMLRAERIFEPEGIEDELGAYNPLIPDGDNWKATFMIEVPDLQQRKLALSQLIGIEDRVWMKVDGFDPVHAIADEDLERETDEKTSSVHFLRFQLTPQMVAAAKRGAAIGVGVDHEHYRYRLDPLPGAVREALLADLE
jgi:hypothetical protein